MDNLIPLNISYLTACLREKGIDVRLFDTTFYKTTPKTSDEARAEMLQVKPADLSKQGIRFKTSDIFEDFKKLVLEYRPDLIGFSVVESTYLLSEMLLNSIRDVKEGSKIIFGGVFAMFAFDKIIKHPLVDMVCYGEGEETIIEVCKNISQKVSLGDIGNLIVKEDGRIFHNKRRSLVDLNELPYLDFSVFDKERFYKPMSGKVLKMVPVEFGRGCPYRCTYCVSPALAEAYKEYGKWFRQKDIKKIIKEIDFYTKKYNVEYFYFISESFLSIQREIFDEFIDYYKSVKIPFWFNTRIETISPDKLKKLESINCNRISIGLESGSEYIRKELLGRSYSNDYFVEKFKMLNDYNISVSINNIIGIPEETREQVFETIELNRRIKAEDFCATTFQPYHGTNLRDYCVQKGYLPEDHLAGDAHLTRDVDIPNMTKEEIAGLQRTFALYVMLPKKYYADIKIAERFDNEGDAKFRELAGLIK